VRTVELLINAFLEDNELEVSPNAREALISDVAHIAFGACIDEELRKECIEIIEDELKTEGLL